MQLFVEAPSVELLERCRKVDLYAIADHYAVLVSKHLGKEELKRLVCEGLVEKRVLLSEPESVSPGSVAAAAMQTPVGGDGVDMAAKAEADVEGSVRAPFTIPRFEPLSLSPARSSKDARVQVRLARLELEKQERDRQAEYEHKLEIRKMELEAEIQMRRLALEEKVALAAQAHQPRVGPISSGSMQSSSPVRPADGFDVSKNISLVPPFRESEVDSYFSVFERIASSLKWPTEVWPLLLQCKLFGKAQEVVSALSLEDSLQYECVKGAVLRAYELVPEAYRQKFRNHRRSPNRTFVEFARDKEHLFDRWCVASKATDFASLRELTLLEEFKNGLPDRLVVYLNEQKVATLSQAAVLADEFVLTHKTVFTGARTEFRKVWPPVEPVPKGPTLPPRSKEERECFYCHRRGHVIADCLKLQHRQSFPPSPTARKPVGLVKTVPARNQVPSVPSLIDPSYDPFIFTGTVSLADTSDSTVPIRILRDTGAAQSVILADVLPWSAESSCGYSVLLQGIEMGHVPVPLHYVCLRSDLVSGKFKVGLEPSLPVQGITLIMGNDIAGGLVLPVLEVFDTLKKSVSCDGLEKEFPTVFPACVVTRAQARRQSDMCDLADSILGPMLSADDVSASPQPLVKESELRETTRKDTTCEFLLPVTYETLRTAQKQDTSLDRCFSSVASHDQAEEQRVAYVIEDGLLVRKWMPRTGADGVWNTVCQVVIPKPFRSHILSLAHDIPWSGHLGVTKTYDRVLRHFFWPGLKRDVVSFCKSCHTCQLMGKPNQVIPPAPLHPIPVMGEPFERVIVDCVGPLPKTKAGNQFLLTVMCAATRYPEAIPLRKITSKVIITALTKFFATFGLPKVVQSDQGSNFLSNLFAQVLQTLNIAHKVSSAYHPQSQGALERWHQTLKSMLRKYCFDTGKDWMRGFPMFCLPYVKLRKNP